MTRDRVFAPPPISVSLSVRMMILALLLAAGMCDPYLPQFQLWSPRLVVCVWSPAWEGPEINNRSLTGQYTPSCRVHHWQLEAIPAAGLVKLCSRLWGCTDARF
ncbi:hypothetical protein DL98DRAFT_87418 [Cadophora sp. DSE1049]|nr:hypothetical protein DL98DRAFT_87418 [Cadophora sp. DSE1049]